jgi:hypothetical protein
MRRDVTIHIVFWICFSTFFPLWPPLSLIYLCAPPPTSPFVDAVTYGKSLLHFQIVIIVIYLQYFIAFKYFVYVQHTLYMYNEQYSVNNWHYILCVSWAGRTLASF